MHARHLVALLFSLALFLGQLAGLGHAASHLTEGDEDRPHAVCELCIAYANLASGACGQQSMPGFGEWTAPAPQADARRPCGALPRPPYASRAPPFLA